MTGTRATGRVLVPALTLAACLWTAEAWFSLGRFHELLDPRGGPFALNRAESTYRMATQAARGAWPLEGYARYALATVLFRQQRYREAVRELSAALGVLSVSCGCT